MPSRDMTQREFDRALERYGITREGEGDDAAYHNGHCEMRVMTPFGRQLPRRRRDLLAKLIKDKERAERRAAWHAHELTPGDRLVYHVPDSSREHFVFVETCERGTVRGIRADGRLVRRDKGACTPAAPNNGWVGPGSLEEAVRAYYHARCRDVAAAVQLAEGWCPGALADELWTDYECKDKGHRVRLCSGDVYDEEGHPTETGGVPLRCPWPGCGSPLGPQWSPF